MKAYKGFKEDMTCLGYQYEEGGTYTAKEAELCKSGFHACGYPMDVFGYYDPANSKYCEVELDDVDENHNSGDSKVCGKKIKIGAEKVDGEVVKPDTFYTIENGKLVECD